MKTFAIKRTKTSVYATTDFQSFLLLDRNSFRPMSDEELTRKTAYKDENGWIKGIEAQSAEDALTGVRESVAEASKELHAKIKARKDADINWVQSKIDTREVIEVNHDNLHKVATYLRSQNWGSWTLPKMSCGYAAHQYDCDGTLAVTIKLDKPLEGETMFQIGAPVGHLGKYARI